MNDNSEKERLISDVASYGSQGGNNPSDNVYLGYAKRNKMRKRTINVLYYNMFMVSISFSIMMSSMWPFLKRIDGDVAESFLGWVNAGFSLSQLVCSFVFGYWVDKRPAREPLLLALFMQIVGSGLYAYSESFGRNGIYVLLAGRLLLGGSSGSISVARAVAAQLTSNKGKAKVLAYVSMFQALGFVVGPAFQAATNPIGTTGYTVPKIDLVINLYTAPCLIIIAMAVLNIIFMFLYFREYSEDREASKEEKKHLRRSTSMFDPVDMVAICVCLVIWFLTMTVFSLNETLLSPILMNEYAWSRSKTTFYGSIILAVSGVLGVFLFLIAAPLAKRFTERRVMFVSFVIVFAAFIVYLPWGPGHPLLAPPADHSNSTNGDEATGCPLDYAWCHTDPHLPFPQLIVGMTLIGIAYPLLCVMLNVIYSKIVGPFPQGKFMGWLSGVGCLARVFGPLYVTTLYEHLGVRWSVLSLDIILLLGIVFIVANWKRFVPYQGSTRTATSISSVDA